MMLNELTGGVFSLFGAGVSMPASAYVVHDFRDPDALLREWGEVARRSFRWQPEWGICYEVRTGYHPSAASADIEARKMALESGYSKPVWWQFWRWRETPLP